MAGNFFPVAFNALLKLEKLRMVRLYLIIELEFRIPLQFFHRKYFCPGLGNRVFVFPQGDADPNGNSLELFPHNLFTHVTGRKLRKALCYLQLPGFV